MANNMDLRMGRKAMYYFVRFIKKTLRYLLKPLSFAPAILMMYLIFTFSGQDGTQSAGLSLKVSRHLVMAYNKIRPVKLDSAGINALMIQIHPYVRKGAHVTEYLLLAMTVALPLYVYRIRGFLLTFIGIVFCVAFAAADEFHQSFVAGRVADPKDVAIDSIGIVIGIIIIQIICHIGRSTIFHWLVLDED